MRRPLGEIGTPALSFLGRALARKEVMTVVAPLFHSADAEQEMTMLAIRSMSPGTITALAAIFGSLVGALGSSAGTWITQRHQDRRDLLARKISHREQLYSDFISESARALVDALEHNVSDPKNLIPAYALLSRIRLSSSTDVLANAEAVVREIIGTYAKPNLTPEQIESRATNGDDPLRKFSDICRAELESMQSQI